MLLLEHLGYALAMQAYQDEPDDDPITLLTRELMPIWQRVKLDFPAFQLEVRVEAMQWLKHQPAVLPLLELYHSKLDSLMEALRAQTFSDFERTWSLSYLGVSSEVHQMAENDQEWLG